MFVLSILFVLVLLSIVYQDFTSRTVALWSLFLLLLVCFIQPMLKIGFLQTITFWGINAAFLILQWVMLMFVFGIKENQWNIFDSLIGLGDILFLMVIAPFFSFSNFLIFYTTSLVVTVISFFLLNNFLKKQLATVPLAGALSICLLIYMLILILTDNKPWEDFPIYFLTIWVQ